MIDYYKNNFNFISNAINPTFPDGLDVAIFSYKILKRQTYQLKVNTIKKMLHQL